MQPKFGRNFRNFAKHEIKLWATFLLFRKNEMTIHYSPLITHHSPPSHSPLFTHPSSLTPLHSPIIFTPHHLPLITYPSSLTHPHCFPLITHLSSLTPLHSPLIFTLYQLPLITHSSSLSSHHSPFIIHLSALVTHPSSLTPHHILSLLILSKRCVNYCNILHFQPKMCISVRLFTKILQN